MIMIIEISLGELGIMSISGHYYDNFKHHPLDNFTHKW
jgi:hypothetical protein